ncbi:hypothetical protein [Bacillus thuringiensis]|uniref:hypothetical protein n=1 Tax=Bacillus thuringiensis TaxID=1428 RepID=UPI003457EE92
MNKIITVNERLIEAFHTFVEDSKQCNESNALKVYLENKIDYLTTLHNIGQTVLRGEKVELSLEVVNQLNHAIEILSTYKEEAEEELNAL